MSLVRPQPIDAGSAEAKAQTDALLATIADPAAIELAPGITLKSALDEARHDEGLAGLVDACRLL
jgi:hypothetical protein